MSLEEKCPKCKKEFSHVPDCLHFHYWCRKCDKEYKLDGVTKWEGDKCTTKQYSYHS